MCYLFCFNVAFLSFSEKNVLSGFYLIDGDLYPETAELQI